MSKFQDRRRFTSAANLPGMAGWNRWRPVRRIIDLPNGGQREQTESEAMAHARSFVLELATGGARQADIAGLLNPSLDPATLRRHFRHELTLGKQRQVVQAAAEEQRIMARLLRLFAYDGWRTEAAEPAYHFPTQVIAGDDGL